jgi:hypothetical protein
MPVPSCGRASPRTAGCSSGQSSGSRAALPAIDAPIGLVPTVHALDTDGLNLSEQDLATALAVDVERWRAELPSIADWFDRIGENGAASQCATSWPRTSSGWAEGYGRCGKMPCNAMMNVTVR